MLTKERHGNTKKLRGKHIYRNKVQVNLVKR